jgi:membrane protein YqaA with SNARE-associated domain
LPAPGLAITFAAAGVFSPFWVGVVAGAGAALGEMTGYLAGFSGQAVIENRQLYERLKSWMQRFGSATVLVLAIIPNPFFDLAGISAGALKMPVYKFLFWCVLGKILKMLAVAYAGFYSIDWLTRFFS